MPRYFIEVSYKGTNYSGFQIQQNANSIQAEIENALKVFFRKDFSLTGSSRTDAGVHALQNFFHFDVENNFKSPIMGDLGGAVYNLNAILPNDIGIKNIFRVKSDAHCRFDAVSREYRYYIYQNKNPFLQHSAYYYPYKLDLKRLNECAAQILKHQDFTSFSKKNTQVNNFICKIEKSEWHIEDDKIVYTVIANRFLRGMVKGLVGTMLSVGTNKISINNFVKIIQEKQIANTDFSPPSHGLFLVWVNFNSNISP